MRESGGNDKAKNPNSSATGRYQFTKGTWLDMMKARPDLGLTASGRGDAEQQERAMDALIDQNGNALKSAGLPVTEATLYAAHFMGSGGAIELLNAGASENAALKFPKAAAANKAIFYHRNGEVKSVGEVVQNLSKGFSAQGGPAPDYYRLVDAGAKVRLTAAAERLADNQIDELDKERRIDESRGVVDYASQNFTDRAEAHQYIKDNVADPSDREQSLRLLDAEYRRADQAARDKRKADFETTFGAVNQAIEAGDPDAAMKAIPKGMNAQDKASLKELVLKGPATVDDSSVLTELTAMRMNSPAEFAALDLRKFQTKLSQPTIERLFAQQQSLNDPKSRFSKFTTIKNANQMVNQSLSEAGIITTAKATEVDRRYARHVQSFVSSEIEAREAELQRSLRATELQEVVDGAFMTFKGPDVGWFTTGEKAWTIKDVLDKFTEIEDDTDGSILPGQLLDMAVKDFRKNAPGTPVTPQMLFQWKEMYQNRKQLQAN